MVVQGERQTIVQLDMRAWKIAEGAETVCRKRESFTGPEQVNGIHKYRRLLGQQTHRRKGKRTPGRVLMRPFTFVFMWFLAVQNQYRP